MLILFQFKTNWNIGMEISETSFKTSFPPTEACNCITLRFTYLSRLDSASGIRLCFAIIFLYISNTYTASFQVSIYINTQKQGRICYLLKTGYILYAVYITVLLVYSCNGCYSIKWYHQWYARVDKSAGIILKRWKLSIWEVVCIRSLSLAKVSWAMHPVRTAKKAKYMCVYEGS